MTNPIDEFKCRKCGGDIIYDDLLNEDYAESKIYADWSGNCKDCGKMYIWREVYTFESIKDFEEGDDDDD